MSVIVNVSFTVKTDSINAFLELMKGVQKELPSVPSCESLIVSQGVDEPERFILVEHWQSQSAHQQHIKGLVDSGAWNTVSQHLLEAPSLTYLQEI